MTLVHHLCALPWPKAPKIPDWWFFVICRRFEGRLREFRVILRRLFEILYSKKSVLRWP